jgi:amino acid adenylation domain-containing protein
MAGPISFSLEYSTALFKEETIQTFIGYFKKIVTHVATPGNLERDLSRIDILEAEEKQQLLEMANGPQEPPDMNQTIPGLFDVQVKKMPEKIAAVGKGGRNGESVQLTYRELDEKARQLAVVLKERGVLADDIVGILAEPCVETIIAVLGILKAGGCYLPIDPDYPRERIDYILRDSNVEILLAGPETLLNLPEGRLIHHSSNRLITHQSGNLAYIIYTSGSTGWPKGVMVEHSSVIRLVRNPNYIRFQEDDRILQTGSLSFDASTFEIWGALLNGLRLYTAEREEILDPRTLSDAVKDRRITIIWMTSGLFNRMCQADVEIFTGLRYLLVGGDVLSPVYINRVRQRYPGLVIINGYGPTENTTFSTTHRIDSEYKENIPIGRPITNSSAFILDKSGYPVPIGVKGELAVGGEGVARGYMNQPELTAEKFIFYRSYRSYKTYIFYKTGDLARWLPDGAIEFLGRKDQQIKIRGQRVELGEIENQLTKHETVKNAVVIARETKGGEKYLCAYIVPYHEHPEAEAVPPSEKSPDMMELNTYLARKLPGYMVPARFVFLEQLPLTPNGKVDRKALPEPDRSRPRLETPFLVPDTHMEKLIAQTWKEVLTVDKIGIHDNFFNLGGDSLSLIEVINRLREILQKEIPVTMMFQYPTIHSLAQHIVEEGKQEEISAAERKAQVEKLDKSKARLKATRKKIK